MYSDFKFKDFGFDLPQELFVNDSLRKTEDVRLIVVDAENRTIKQDMFTNVINYFDRNDVLVFNNSGISASRLSAKLPNGEIVDICFLMQNQEDEAIWESVVLYEGANPIGSEFVMDGGIKGVILKKTSDFDGGYWVEKDRYEGFRGLVKVDVDANILREVLSEKGKLMHPWYADLNKMNKSMLNPITSSKAGSVLLSEPGRRITPKMLEILTEKGVGFMNPTLNMSFSWQVVQAEQRLVDYHMNYEEFEMNQENIDILNDAIKNNKRIISVGTSGARILESLETPPKAINSRTNLFISPGFKLKYTDGLLTNLHNSMGTHVIMASAFADREIIIEACNIAVKEGYRFGIHGDSMLILGNRNR